ncbi:MAG: Cna B-type domain-containing protein [Anaerovoracaceae bacterium]
MAGTYLSSYANPETESLSDGSTPGSVESLDPKDGPKIEGTQKEEITSVPESSVKESSPKDTERSTAQPGMETSANTRPAERGDTPAVFEINDYVFEKPYNPSDPEDKRYKLLNMIGEESKEPQEVKTNFSWKVSGVAGVSAPLPAGSVVISLPTIFVPRDTVKQGLYDMYAELYGSFGKFFVKTIDPNATPVFDIDIDEAGNVKLTNKIDLEAGSTGTFDVNYTVLLRMLYQDYEVTTQPTITVNGIETAVPGLTFKAGVEEDPPYIVKQEHRPYKAASADPDYYWSEYTISSNKSKIYSLGHDFFRIMYKPSHEGEIVKVIKDGKEVEFTKNSNGWYVWDYTPTKEERLDDAKAFWHSHLNYKVIVKYDKTKVKNVGVFERIYNPVYVYGRPWAKDGLGEFSLLGNAVAIHDFGDYDFSYWEGIDLKKRTNSQRFNTPPKNIDTISRTYMSVPGTANFTYHLGAKNPWERTEPYDLAICDDFMDLKNKAGRFVQLTDNEYKFLLLRVDPSTITKLDGTPLEKDYDYEIHLRTAGNSDFVKHGSYKISQGYQRLELPEGVVGFKFVLKNQDQPMNLGNDRSQLITVEGTITMDKERAEDVMVTKNINSNVEEAYLRNLTFLELYEPNGNVIPFPLTEDNYSGSQGQEIAQRDMDTYGRYLFRRYGDIHVVGDELSQLNGKTFSENALDKDSSGNPSFSSKQPYLKNDTTKEKFTGFLQMWSSFANPWGRSMPLSGFTFYDILPAGMEWNEDFTIDDVRFISRNRNQEAISVIKPDGSIEKVPNNKIEQFLKDHAEITVTPNYKDSGRQKITIKLDFRGDKIFSEENELSLGASLPVQVTYENRFRHGSLYINNSVLLVHDVPEGAIRRGNLKPDDGSYITSPPSDKALWSDIDEDGDTSTLVTYANRALLLPAAAGSDQRPEKFVKNKDGEYYQNPRVADVIAGKEFSYKLQITSTGGNMIDMVLYDVLPHMDDRYYDLDLPRNTQWEPEFVSVDIDALKKQGVDAKVYYTDRTDPPKLIRDDNTIDPAWQTAKPKKVGAIAIDLRKKTDGGDFILDHGKSLSAEVHMKAPEGREDWAGKIAHNTFYYEKKGWDHSTNERIGNILPSESNDTLIRYQSNRTDITAEKVWKGGPEKRPDITLQLFRNGIPHGDPVLLPGGETKYTWKDLEEFDDSGKEYRYTVDEVTVPKGYKKTLSQDGLTITNTYEKDSLKPTPDEPSDKPKTDQPGKVKGPKTGDGSTAGFILIMMLASALAIVALSSKRIRSQK